MRATWIVNGLQTQELSAEKTLLLEEQLTFSYYTASQICYGGQPLAVIGIREASCLIILLLFIVCV